MGVGPVPRTVEGFIASALVIGEVGVGGGADCALERRGCSRTSIHGALGRTWVNPMLGRSRRGVDSGERCPVK